MVKEHKISGKKNKNPNLLGNIHRLFKRLINDDEK